MQCLLVADSVEEVREQIGVHRGARPPAVVDHWDRRVSAGFGLGIGTSFASLRRFWAVAARRNSSRAPVGPRSLSRSSLRMRLRCAKSISTFLRSRRDTWPSQDFAIARAMSRAPSWIDRGTLSYLFCDPRHQTACSTHRAAPLRKALRSKRVLQCRDDKVAG